MNISRRLHNTPALVFISVCVMLSSCGKSAPALDKTFENSHLSIAYPSSYQVAEKDNVVFIKSENVEFSITYAPDASSKTGDTSSINQLVSSLTQTLTGKIIKNEPVELEKNKIWWIETQNPESVIALFPFDGIVYNIQLTQGDYENQVIETASNMAASFVAKITKIEKQAPSGNGGKTTDPQNPSGQQTSTDPEKKPTGGNEPVGKPDVEVPNKLPTGESFENDYFKIILPKNWTVEKTTDMLITLFPPDKTQGSIMIATQTGNTEKAENIAKIMTSSIEGSTTPVSVQLGSGIGYQFVYSDGGIKQVQTVYTKDDKYYAITYVQNKQGVDLKQDYDSLLLSLFAK